MVTQLIEAAGSTHAIDVEFTRDEAQVSFAIGQNVITYAYRDGQISAIDSDTAYVGQAIFDPRQFNLDHLTTLFDQAAAIAGSSQNQRLQIVDYDSGHIYMTVTTNPETLPVFFAPDGTLVPLFDPSQPTDVASALAAIVGNGTPVLRIGIDSDQSLYVDLGAGADHIMHIVRSAGFPLRDQIKTDSSQPEPFDSSLVSGDMIAAILTRTSNHLGKSLSDGFALVIEQPAGDTSPTATVTLGTKTVRLSLTGVVLTG